MRTGAVDGGVSRETPHPILKKNEKKNFLGRRFIFIIN